MRATTLQTQEAWESGQFVGVSKPMVRATIQRLSVMLTNAGDQVYSSISHGQTSQPRELPNVKSVSWGRSVDGNVATMRMTLWNTKPAPIGSVPEAWGELDLPGYYSPKRGAAFFSGTWEHETNDWQSWLVPDRLIRTYEGFGFSPELAPELDAHLYQSGLWRIDDVVFDTEGLINIEARDIGSALLDQVLMPPVVPMASYPLYFETKYSVDNPDIVTTVGGWFRPTYDTDGNVYWVGSSRLHGHHGIDAFDSSNSSYWLSVGNIAPAATYSFEWLQGKFSSRTVSAVRLKTWGGPYQVYVSVWSGGKWQGTKNVPYVPHATSGPNFSKIRYSYSFTAKREALTTFKLPTAITGATKVRLTFTKLMRTSISGSGIGGPYRAGVRTFEVSSAVTTTTDGGTHLEPTTTPPGITDYTDVIKTLLAYAGWHWPSEASRSFRTLSTGATVVETPASPDPILRTGRVWGDFEIAGTSPVAPLGIDAFDKKPVMDGINLVKDTLGYIFFIDEEGGAVFRSPNIWAVGNWVGTGAVTAGRTATIIELDETKTILSLSASLSSRSIREKIFVGNLAGQVAGMSPGHNPYPSGLRRVAGWTDQHFKTDAECQIMADLIALRQLFTYRTDKVRIPGNPAIQIDDQVRIFERITEEGYLHYVTGIQMSWELETGRYTYDLSTHWLGETPFTDWTFDPNTMSAETQAYLVALGRISP